MTISSDALRFSRPPVRSVSLAVFFDKIEGLKLTSLAPLVTEIKKRFPQVQERFAELPWVLEEDDDASDIVPPGYLPFPYLSFANGSGQSINFQDDRFRVTWEFSDGADYPGFEDLRSDLQVHLRQFADHVATEVGSELATRHVRVRYDNDLGSSSSPSEVMLRSYGSDPVALETNSKGLTLVEPTFHATVPVEDDQVQTEVFVLAVEQESETRLTLRATARAVEGAELDCWGLLESAHSTLTGTFDQLSSDEQKQSWGVEK
jgi:uncharacterized protein (TIGR04255 family)